MNTAPQILAGLTDALRAARHASRQYALHADLCRSWGLSGLDEEHLVQSGSGHRHGELLLDRIHALRGEPAPRSAEPAPPQTITQMLERDLHVERDSFRRFFQLARLCREADDTETLELMESSMLDAELQIERLEGQLDLIDEVGEGEFARDWAGEFQYA